MNDNAHGNQVPLANWQKLRLLYDCVPFVFFAVISLIVLAVIPMFVEADSSTMLLTLFVGFVLLVLGFQAVQRLRDLISGQAVVTTDVLQRSRSSRGGTRQLFFGNFERLGRMRLVRKAHFGSHNGQRYKVTYSPVSKIVWSLEPVS